MISNANAGNNAPRSSLPPGPLMGNPSALHRESPPVITIRRNRGDLGALESVDHLQRSAAEADPHAQHLAGSVFPTRSGAVQREVEMMDGLTIDAWQAAADAGHAGSQVNLGVCYASGLGVEKDAQTAIALFRQAAQQGNPAAKLNLAVSHAMGDGVAVDLNQALHLLNEAADGDNMMAQHWLGLCFETGCGVARDRARAVELFERAADQGYSPSQCMLGYLYEAEPPTSANLARAAQWYEKAAAAGDVAAQCQLAAMYASGRGVEVDARKSASLYERAASGGSAQANFIAGALSVEARAVDGTTSPFSRWKLHRARLCWAEAAASNHPGAQLALGRMYYAGTGVPMDLKRAFKYMLRAARNGEVFAQYTVALMYSQGKGVTADNATAAQWWNRAACRNDPDVTFEFVRDFGSDRDATPTDPVSLARHTGGADRGESVAAAFLAGMAHELGVDVDANFDRALACYRKAAAAGHSSAQYRLGCIFADHPELAPHDETAALWLRMAADQGHAEAQVKLAFLYWRGDGVEHDEAVADSWLRKAVAKSRTAQALHGLLYEATGADGATTVSHEEFIGPRVPAAMYLLGCRYAAGNGVERNPELARQWWARAAVHGHPAAQLCLEWPIL